MRAITIAVFAEKRAQNPVSKRAWALHNDAHMQTRRGAVALVCGLMCWGLTARPEASGAIFAGAVAATHDAAVHELLEGPAGRRQSWTSAPALVIETSVMDYASGDLTSGFNAVDTQLTNVEMSGAR
jgi:hypothetical protein